MTPKPTAAAARRNNNNSNDNETKSNNNGDPIAARTHTHTQVAIGTVSSTDKLITTQNDNSNFVSPPPHQDREESLSCQ